MSSALSEEKLESDSLVKIFWPREKCRLIRDDVVLVDRYCSMNTHIHLLASSLIRGNSEHAVFATRHLLILPSLAPECPTRLLLLFSSPGLDVSTNLDQWIEKHCLDADVFVLVISAEATIAGAVSVTSHCPFNVTFVEFQEKKFFHTVAERLSNPNVFILMNRWDAADHEPDTMDSVGRPIYSSRLPD